MHPAECGYEGMILAVVVILKHKKSTFWIVVNCGERAVSSFAKDASAD